MMTVYAIADLHGHLPHVPECQLLLLGGDYCNTGSDLDAGRKYLDTTFRKWLEDQPAKYIVGIAGNHDFILEADPEFANTLPWCYLQDDAVDLEGVKIYGTPRTCSFNGKWAFQSSERDLDKHFESIPEGLDILLSHGPAYRQLDEVRDGTYLIHAGSVALYDRVVKAKPNAVVFGHIHGARGIKDVDGVRYYNATQMNGRHEPLYNVMKVDLIP